MRLSDSCITQLKAQGPSRTCNESQEEEGEGEEKNYFAGQIIILETGVNSSLEVAGGGTLKCGKTGPPGVSTRVLGRCVNLAGLEAHTRGKHALRVALVRRAKMPL